MYKLALLVLITVLVIGLVVVAPLRNEAMAAGNAEAEAEAQSNAQPMNDAWIAAKIESSYLMDDQLSPFDIEVSVDGSVVTLRGEVASELERERAEQIASEQDGVTSVQNELRIAPNASAAEGEPAARTVANTPQESAQTSAETSDESADDMGDSMRDAGITAKVKSRLVLHFGMTAFAINVDTENQVVQLTGSVEDAETIQQVEQVAQSTSGVLRVNNLLQVKTAAAAY